MVIGPLKTSLIVLDLRLRVYSFGAMAKALRPFIASHHSQPMCPKCAILTFLRPVTGWLKFDPYFLGLLGGCGVGIGPIR